MLIIRSFKYTLYIEYNNSQQLDYIIVVQLIIYFFSILFSTTHSNSNYCRINNILSKKKSISKHKLLIKYVRSIIRFSRLIVVNVASSRSNRSYRINRRPIGCSWCLLLHQPRIQRYRCSSFRPMCLYSK